MKKKLLLGLLILVSLWIPVLIVYLLKFIGIYIDLKSIGFVIIYGVLWYPCWLLLVEVDNRL